MRAAAAPSALLANSLRWVRGEGWSQQWRVCTKWRTAGASACSRRWSVPSVSAHLLTCPQPLHAWHALSPRAFDMPSAPALGASTRAKMSCQSRAAPVTAMWLWCFCSNAGMLPVRQHFLCVTCSAHSACISVWVVAKPFASCASSSNFCTVPPFRPPHTHVRMHACTRAARIHAHTHMYARTHACTFKHSHACTCASLSNLTCSHHTCRSAKTSTRSCTCIWLHVSFLAFSGVSLC